MKHGRNNFHGGMKKLIVRIICIVLAAVMVGLIILAAVFSSVW